MARINYPEDFIRQAELFKEMKARHDADGSASKLNDFLTENEISLADDATDTTNAIAKHKLFSKASRIGERHRKERDKLFKPILKKLTSAIQFLKKFYAGNSGKLGDWGVTVNGNRVVIPPEFEKRVQLFKDFKEEHDTLGSSSPLTAFLTENEFDLAASLLKVGDAETQHTAMSNAKKEAEDHREDRDNLFNPVLAHVRAIGQYLKGLFPQNPHELGRWGYTVDDSPRDPKFRESTIGPASSKTITGIKLGSQAENTGTVPLLLHKGKEISPEPFTLEPEMRFTIKRGFGTLTVENPDAAQEGKIGYITTRI